MAKVVKRVRSHLTELQKEVLKQMITLSTSGLGLVAALAWNELIKELISEFIKPLLGASSGIISLLVYAVIVTLLAVFVTYSLTRILDKGKK